MRLSTRDGIDIAWELVPIAWVIAGVGGLHWLVVNGHAATGLEFLNRNREALAAFSILVSKVLSKARQNAQLGPVVRESDLDLDAISLALDRVCDVSPALASRLGVDPSALVDVLRGVPKLLLAGEQPSDLPVEAVPGKRRP